MRAIADANRYRQLRWMLCIVLVVVAALPSAAWLASNAEATAKSSRVASDSQPERSVVAPGRIQPKDGVLTIAAPASQWGPAIVAQLHVQQGDWVERGHVVASLRGREELEAALVSSERKVAIAQARLAALKAGGKEDDVRALRSQVASAEANLAQVAADTRRVRQLRDDHILSAASVEAQESRLALATGALEAERARLSALSSVRPADLAIVQAELHAVEADADEARVRLESTTVRAPFAGRVLAIHAHPGQSVGPRGVLAFAQTTEMYVDAEVMEADLQRTRVGQKVSITGDVLAEAAAGTVEEIGYLVGSREVFDADPTAFADSRVVHVKVRIAEPAKLERFIDARVTVEMRP
jgi:HlyD family secretion protein